MDRKTHMFGRSGTWFNFLAKTTPKLAMKKCLWVIIILKINKEWLHKSRFS